MRYRFAAGIYTKLKLIRVSNQHNGDFIISKK